MAAAKKRAAEEERKQIEAQKLKAAADKKEREIHAAMLRQKELREKKRLHDENEEYAIHRAQVLRDDLRKSHNAPPSSFRTHEVVNDSQSQTPVYTMQTGYLDTMKMGAFGAGLPDINENDAALQSDRWQHVLIRDVMSDPAIREFRKNKLCVALGKASKKCLLATVRN